MSARYLSQYFLSAGVVTILTSIPVRGSGGPGWWWRGVWPSSPPLYTITWLAPRRSEITMSWCPRCNDSVQVQQELARPGRLERFLTDEDQIRQVRRLFTGLYSLDQVIIHSRMSVLCWLDLVSGCWWWRQCQDGSHQSWEVCAEAPEGGRWQQRVRGGHQTRAGEDAAQQGEDSLHPDGQVIVTSLSLCSWVSPCQDPPPCH